MSVNHSARSGGISWFNSILISIRARAMKFVSCLHLEGKISKQRLILDLDPYFMVQILSSKFNATDMIG